MKHIRAYLLVISALALSLGMFLSSGSGTSQAQLLAPDVRVVNTSGNPVPVKAQGTTNIAGAVSINNSSGNPVPVQAQGTTTVGGTVLAQQSGNWNLGIDPAHNLVKLDESARQPVLINLGELIRDTTFFSCCSAHYNSDLYTVPEGKTLVIEQVLLQIDVPTGVMARGKLAVSEEMPISGGGTIGTVSRFPFLFTLQGSKDGSAANIDHLAASQTMKLYITNRAGSGAHKTVSCEVTPQSNGSSSGIDATLSGYLEPAP